MPPKLTVYFDVERSYLSVAHLIKRHMLPTGEQVKDKGGENENAHVIRVRCRTYKDVMDGIYNLKRGKLVTKEEMENLGAVGLDTVSRLADQTRKQVVNNNSMTDEYFDLWTRRDSMHAQWSDWGTMTTLISEICSKASSWCEDNNVPFIIGSHERLAEDKLEDKALKGGMDLNGKLLSEIEENSDYVWRCFRQDAAFKLGTVQHPAGTYFLQTSTSAKRRTKVRMPPDVAARLGDFRANPNLRDIFETLGIFTPSVLSLFGSPGGGKSTLMTSLSDPKYYPKEGK